MLGSEIRKISEKSHRVAKHPNGRTFLARQMFFCRRILSLTVTSFLSFCSQDHGMYANGHAACLLT